MDDSFGKLDPFGRLPARLLVQSWLASLASIHGLWLLFALVMARWSDATFLVALLLGLVAALLAAHPAVKIALLGAWNLWWAIRFVRWPSLHLGVVVMMGMSLYVIARLALAWRRLGAESVRVGWGHPLPSAAGWSELAGLTKAERRLVLRRAGARLGRPKLLTRRVLLGFAVAMAISLLEALLVPAHDLGGDSQSVAIPRSALGFVLILPLLMVPEPRGQEATLRRLLRDEILPEFHQQPWLWDAARRASVRRSS